MLTQDLIDKIREQLYALYEQTRSIDERNAKIKSKHFKYRDHFNQRLFRCESTALMDYVREVDDNFTQLLRLAQDDKTQLNLRGEQLTEQLTALTQVVRGNEVAVKEHRYQQTSNKKRFAQYKKTAQHFMANSHELHQELAQNHEFERRLNEMIFERQARMNQVDDFEANQLQKEILALHQRLGKCRRAITKVEEQIQLVDSKNRF
jgi:primosomal replication protein N''